MFHLLKNRKTRQSDSAVLQDKRKGGKDSSSEGKNEAEELLDDVSFIQEMRHIQGAWHQYDILLATRGYGWETMVDWASYMESADLEDVATITISSFANAPETELIEDYRESKGSIKEFGRLSMEEGQLAIGGISRTLNAPVKLVWFNQTRVLRVFTPIDDETLMTKYIETVIRRTFGTVDAMKRAKPVLKK